MTIGALVLAAGSGSRFAGATHKLRFRFRGRPLVAWSVDAARGAGFDEVIVVTGATDLHDLLPPDVTVLVNDAWAEGQASSLQLGIEHCRRAGHSAVVVGLADQPLVPSSAWRRVRQTESAPIVAASYDGTRRNPVRLSRSVWPLLPVTGDHGARALIRARPDLLADVPCEGDPTDVDTLEDLTQLAEEDSAPSPGGQTVVRRPAEDCSRGRSSRGDQP